jgi:hypothetical protein
MNRFMSECLVPGARVSTQLAAMRPPCRLPYAASPQPLVATAAIKIRERVSLYGFGLPATVFGRVTR